MDSLQRVPGQTAVASDPSRKGRRRRRVRERKEG
jgi:hypothetical protein